jgi:hypothetical protein
MLWKLIQILTEWPIVRVHVLDYAIMLVRVVQVVLVVLVVVVAVVMAIVLVAVGVGKSEEENRWIF